MTINKKIKKLLESPNRDDVILGFHLLSNKYGWEWFQRYLPTKEKYIFTFPFKKNFESKMTFRAKSYVFYIYSGKSSRVFVTSEKTRNILLKSPDYDFEID